MRFAEPTNSEVEGTPDILCMMREKPEYENSCVDRQRSRLMMVKKGGGRYAWSGFLSSRHHQHANLNFAILRVTVLRLIYTRVYRYIPGTWSISTAAI